MMTHDDLEKIREENEAEDTWRKYSRHVVADMLEACAICGTIREKEHLARCRWCEDVYFCKRASAPSSTKLRRTPPLPSGPGRLHWLSEVRWDQASGR